MGKIGIPVLRLKASSYKPKASDKKNRDKGKHSGNARAVALEALEERKSKDADLDRDLTENNLYFKGGFTSGKELADYWEQEAAGYRITDKNGKQKRLRSDATIGFTYIVKPDEEYMSTLSEDEQARLLYDAVTITREIFEKRGLVIDAGVTHVDERNPHTHIFGHDPEYKLSDKIDIRLFGELNREVPKRMRELGWDIQDCGGYDLEAAQQMTPEEKKAYGEKRAAEKRENGNAYGRTSEVYKANRKLEDAVRIRANAASRMGEAKAKERDVTRRESDVAERERNVAQREEAARELLERARRTNKAADEKIREADQDRSEAARERERAQQERTANAALTQQLKAAIGDAETAKDAYGSVKPDSMLEAFFKQPTKSGGTIGDLYRAFVERKRQTIAEQVRPRVERAKAVLSRATKRELPKGAEDIMRQQHKSDEYEF